eukprot:4713192-Heterocapsa_arctica.AAC.1
MPIVLRCKAARTWVECRGVACEAERRPPLSPVGFQLRHESTNGHRMPSSVCVDRLRLSLASIVSSLRVNTPSESCQCPS